MFYTTVALLVAALNALVCWQGMNRRIADTALLLVMVAGLAFTAGNGDPVLGFLVLGAWELIGALVSAAFVIFIAQ